VTIARTDEITFHVIAARTSPEIDRSQLLDDLARWLSEWRIDEHRPEAHRPQ